MYTKVCVTLLPDCNHHASGQHPSLCTHECIANIVYGVYGVWVYGGGYGELTGNPVI